MRLHAQLSSGPDSAYLALLITAPLISPVASSAPADQAAGQGPCLEVPGRLAGPRIPAGGVAVAAHRGAMGASSSALPAGRGMPAPGSARDSETGPSRQLAHFGTSGHPLSAGTVMVDGRCVAARRERPS